MNWYLSAILAAVAYSGQILGMQRLQKNYPIHVYMAYLWLGAGLLITALFFRSTAHFTLKTGLFLCLAAVGSFTGMYAMNMAIRLQTNIGYVTAVSSLQLAVIYALSMFFFGAVFEAVRLLAVFGIAVGAVLVIGIQSKNGNTEDKTWVIWTLATTVCFTLLFFSVRTVTEVGMDSRVVTGVIMLLAGLGYAASAVSKKETFRIKNESWMIGLTLLFSVVGNIAFFSSLATSPNMAYTQAIANAQIIILYLVALATGAGRLEPVKAIGVLLAFACVTLLA